MKIINEKLITVILVIMILLFGISSMTYEIEATSYTYKLYYDRAPRVSFKRDNKNKLILEFRDSGNVDLIELAKYDTSQKTYKDINLKSNKIVVGSYNKKTNIRKVEIPANFFKINELTKIRIKTKNYKSNSSQLIATYIIKRLDKKNKDNKWFSANFPANMEFKTSSCKSGSKVIKVKMTDNNGIEEVVVQDVNNGNKEILNKRYNAKQNQGVTIDLNLSKAKIVANKGYKVTFIVKSPGTTRRETMYIKGMNDWSKLGYQYNKNGVACPRYFQSDKKWTKIRYTAGGYGKTIGEGGCGACALAMAVSGLTQKLVTPVEIVQYLNRININTIYNSEAATKKVASKYGLTYEHIDRRDKAKVNAALDAGKCLIFSISANGIYTGGSHFIMCSGRVGNNYYVLESSGTNYYKTNRAYTYNQVFSPGISGVYVLGVK